MGNLIVKHNAFIEANYDLDLVANRVLLLAILNARQISDDVQTALKQEIVITAKQYMNCFEVSKTSAYEALKNGLDLLYRAEFTYNEIVADGEFKGTIEKRSYHFLQGKVETDNCSYIALHFSNIVAPLVIGLQNRFTTYEIEQISKLQSKYALRLYELAISKKSLGKKFTITLLDLRKKFGVLPNEFSQMRDFKKRVLNKSVDEINQHTDIILNYEQEKEGRNIVGFVFSFEFKEGAIDGTCTEAKNNEQSVIIPYNASDECFADCAVKLLKKDKKKYKEQYSDEQIKAIITRANEYADELLEQGKKVAYGAIYRKAFEEDWGKEVLLKRQKKIEKNKADQTQKNRIVEKKSQEKERLKEIKEIYQTILGDEELIKEYIAHNIYPKGLSGIEEYKYKTGDFVGLFKLQDYKFDIQNFKNLKLSFMGKVNTETKAQKQKRRHKLLINRFESLSKEEQENIKRSIAFTLEDSAKRQKILDIHGQAYKDKEFIAEFALHLGMDFLFD